MEGEQRYPIPLDSSLDINSGDMLVPVDAPKFSYNRQRKIGDAMPNSVRYEDFGWFAGWLKHTFVKENLHEASIDLKNSTVTITPHTVEGLYTYWSVEIMVWKDATHTAYKQRIVFTYLPSSTDLVCLLGNETSVVREGDVVKVAGRTNTGDFVYFTFNYKSREFSDVVFRDAKDENLTAATAYSVVYRDDEGVDQFNAVQAASETAAVVIIPGQSALFSSVLLPYTFNVQGKEAREHWWGDTFFDAEDKDDPNKSYVKVNKDRYPELEISGNDAGSYTADGVKNIFVKDNSLATIVWAFLFHDYWTKVEVQSAQSLSLYLGENSNTKNVLNQTECSVTKDPSGSFIVQYGVPVWLRHTLKFKATRSLDDIVGSAAGTPRPLDKVVWAISFRFIDNAYNRSHGYITEEQKPDDEGKQQTFTSSSCSAHIDVDWEKEVEFSVTSPFLRKDQYDDGKAPKVCIGGDANYDPTIDLYKHSIAEYNATMDTLEQGNLAGIATDHTYKGAIENVMRIPFIWKSVDVPKLERVIPRWSTVTAKLKRQDTKGLFEGETGFDGDSGIATIRTKNFSPLRYIVRKYTNHVTYDPRLRVVLPSVNAATLTSWGGARTAMTNIKELLKNLDVVSRSDIAREKEYEPIRFKTRERAALPDVKVDLTRVIADVEARAALSDAAAATSNTVFNSYKDAQGNTCTLIEEYVISKDGAPPLGSRVNPDFNPIIINSDLKCNIDGSFTQEGDVFRLLYPKKSYDPRPYVVDTETYDAQSKANPEYTQPYVFNKGQDNKDYNAYIKNTENRNVHVHPFNNVLIWAENYVAKAKDYTVTSPFFKSVYPGLEVPEVNEVYEHHVSLTSKLYPNYNDAVVPYANITVSVATVKEQVFKFDPVVYNGVLLDIFINDNRNEDGKNTIVDEVGNEAPALQLSTDNGFTTLYKPTYEAVKALHNVADLQNVHVKWAVGTGTLQDKTYWEQTQLRLRVEKYFTFFKVATDDYDSAWVDTGEQSTDYAAGVTYQDVESQKQVLKNIELWVLVCEDYVYFREYGVHKPGTDPWHALMAYFHFIKSSYWINVSTGKVKEFYANLKRFKDTFCYCTERTVPTAGGITYKDIVMTDDKGAILGPGELLDKYIDAETMVIPNHAMGSIKVYPVPHSTQDFERISKDEAKSTFSSVLELFATGFLYSEWSKYYKRTRKMCSEKNVNVCVVFVSVSVGEQEYATPFSNKHLFRIGVGLNQRTLGDVKENPLLASSSVARFNPDLGTLNSIPDTSSGDLVPMQGSSEKKSALLTYDVDTQIASATIPQCVRAYAFTKFDFDVANDAFIVDTLMHKRIPVRAIAQPFAGNKRVWDFTATEDVVQHPEYLCLAELIPNTVWQYDRTNNSIVNVNVTFKKSTQNKSGTPLYVASVPVTEDVQLVDDKGNVSRGIKVNSVYPAWMVDPEQFAKASYTMAPLAISGENGIGFQVTLDIGLSHKITSIDGTLQIERATPFNTHLFDRITLPRFALPAITKDNYKELIIQAPRQHIILYLTESTKIIIFDYDNFAQRIIHEGSGVEIISGSTNLIFEPKNETFSDNLEAMQSISLQGTNYYVDGDKVTLRKVRLQPDANIPKIAPSLDVLWQNGNVIKFNDFYNKDTDKTDNVYGAYNYVSHELIDANRIVQRRVVLEDEERKQEVFLSRINGLILRFNAKGVRKYHKDISYIGSTQYVNGHPSGEVASNEIKVKVTTYS